ncbi:MAG: hypothetical protein AB7V16_07405 [Vulcanibacillus sp.]
MCRLVSWGYDYEDNIVKKPLHIILSRYKWFKKLKEEEAKAEMAMMNRMTCPFMTKPKKKNK